MAPTPRTPANPRKIHQIPLQAVFELYCSLDEGHPVRTSTLAVLTELVPRVCPGTTVENFLYACPHAKERKDHFMPWWWTCTLAHCQRANAPPQEGGLPLCKPS